MSDVFIMVMFIVLVAVGGSVISDYLKTQRRLADRRGLNDDEHDRELADLRARVEVLERIVTDQGYSLRRELDAL
ncbi:MAG: hypothetical protein AAF515_12500 [Pseudomonadota bacterium]